MAGRLPGSSSRHLGKKEGGEERREGRGRVIVHKKEEEESATYFFRAAMAAISCSLSACVVPKYCQPCVCRCACANDCRHQPTSLSSSSLLSSFSLFFLLSSFIHFPPPLPLPPPTLMLSGLACTCSTWQFTVSLFYDIIDNHMTVTSASKSSTALGRSPSFSLPRPSSSGLVTSLRGLSAWNG